MTRFVFSGSLSLWERAGVRVPAALSFAKRKQKGTLSPTLSRTKPREREKEARTG
jgi:hypothetical protein